MSRLITIEAAAQALALEALSEQLQERKLELMRALWSVSIDREITEINRHLEQIDAKCVLLRAAGAMALDEVAA